MASVYRRTLHYVRVTAPGGGSAKRRVSAGEAARLRKAGQAVEEVTDERWHVRYRDATGAWRDERCLARTKTEAQRLADDLDRKAERQRHGLEPMPGLQTLTLGELCEWWLKHKCPAASLSREKSRLRKHVIGDPIGQLLVQRLTTARIDERLRDMEVAGLSPNTVNHLRRRLSTVFRRAGKAGVWTGPNPVVDVEVRREHERAYVTLKLNEIALFLVNVPEQWRALFAMALFLGLRKGELFALRKSDIDFDARTVTIHSSHERATTKGGHVDTLPIPDQLVPFLKYAVEKSGSEFVFPSEDGKRHPSSTNLAVLTRRILGRAGIVDGYDHVCRRCKAKGREDHTERFPDDVERRCKRCKMRLWPKAIPRPMRFHDTRHTFGTLLAQGGFDGVRLQRAMRHRDFKMTARYVHTNVDDLRAVTNILPRTNPVPFAGSLLDGAKSTKNEGPGSREISKENPALQLARPRGFEPLAFGFVVRRSIQLS